MLRHCLGDRTPQSAGENAENMKSRHAKEVVFHVLGGHILIVLDGEEL